jgi:hypothetical protein
MKLQIRASLLIAVLALVAALSGVGGVYAGTVLITGKQIKNGSLTTQDYRNGSVRTTDVRNGTIDSADIGNNEVSTADIGEGEVRAGDIGSNQVQPTDLQLPAPQQGVEAGTSSAAVSEEFTVLDPVETYVKVDPTSVLEVTWTGSAAAGFSPCQFQVRVDGNPPADEAGTVYVGNGTVNGNITTSVTFAGLGEGPHEIAIYARAIGGGGTFPCTVGPEQAQIKQTFIIAEQVV